MGIIKRLLNKYHNLKPSLKGTLWFSFAMILQKGVNIIATPIFTRLFTLEEYGTHSLYSTWLNILVVLCTFNISGEVYNALFHRYEKEEKDFVANSIYIELMIFVFATIILVLYQIFIGNLQGITPEILILILINILVNIPISIWLAKSKYINDYFIPSLVVIIQSLVSFALSIAFVVIFDEKVIARIMGNIIPMIIVMIISLLFVFKKGIPKINWKMIKQMFIISAPLIFYYLAIDILGQSDRLFLENYQGKEVVAVYSLVYQLSFLAVIVITSVNSTLCPWVYRKLSVGETSKCRKIIPIYFVFISLILILVVLLGPEVILIFGGSEYSEGITIIPILISTVVLVLFYDIYTKVEFYYEKTAIASVITMIAAGLNVLLNSLMVPNYGMVGASIATLISYSFMAIAHYVSSKIILKKKNNLKDYFNDKFTIGGVIVLIAFMMTINLWYEISWLRFIIAGIIIVATIVVIIVNHKKILALAFRKKKNNNINE